MHKTKALVLERDLQLVHFGAVLLCLAGIWYHLDFWHCHLIAAEKNEAFPHHTVMCAQEENLDAEFIQQQAFISMIIFSFFQIMER